MSDKKALFAGRTGDKSFGERKSAAAVGTSSPPPPPTGERKSRSPPMYSRGAGARGVAATVERRKIQLKEAEENRKAANKCLQKTMTRWNPNFFSAAPLFEKAATCYRAAGEENNATAMFITAGECHSHESVMAQASAAKCFREAALITERQNRGDEAAALYLRCAEAWVHADEAGRAAEYLGRSAKLVEADDEDAAAERYIHASKVMVPDGSDATTNFVRVVGGVDILVQGIRFLASAGRLDECMSVVDRYCIILSAEGIEHSLGRMYLTYCILALAQGDYVKANKAFTEIHLQSTSYLRSDECRVEEDLLIAFKEFKPDLLKKAQNERMLRRLEPPIVALAKSLRIDDDEGGAALRKKQSGTIEDVKARIGALREGHGRSSSSPAAPSSFSAPSPPVPRRPAGNASAGGGAGGAAALPLTAPSAAGVSVAGGDNRVAQSHTVAISNVARGDDSGDAAAKNDLFGASPARKAIKESAAGKEQVASSPLSSVAAAAASNVPVRANGNNEMQGDAGLDLGDLEATLVADSGAGAAAGEDEEDLDAMIAAAKKEAEALGGLEDVGAVVGNFDDGDEDDEDEEDIDLT